MHLCHNVNEPLLFSDQMLEYEYPLFLNIARKCSFYLELTVFQNSPKRNQIVGLLWKNITVWVQTAVATNFARQLFEKICSFIVPLVTLISLVELRQTKLGKFKVENFQFKLGSLSVWPDGEIKNSPNCSKNWPNNPQSSFH